MSREVWEDVDEELRAHLELSAAFHRARGRDGEDARRHASSRFGDLARVRRSVLEEYRPPWLRLVSRMGQVVTVAVPWGAFVATVGVLIGLHGRLPLTFQRDAEWVSISQNREDSSGVSAFSSFAEFEAIAALPDAVEAVYAVHYDSHLVSGSFPTQRARVKAVSPGYVSSLGAGIQLGRAFSPGDEGRAIVVLTHRAWEAWYASSSAALGERLQIDGIDHQIVGVLQRGVEFFYDTQLLAPISARVERRQGEPRLLVGARIKAEFDRVAAEAVVNEAVPAARLTLTSKVYARPYTGAVTRLAALLGLLSIWSIGAAVRSMNWSSDRWSGWSLSPVLGISDPLLPVVCGAVLGSGLGVVLSPAIGAAVVGGVVHPFDFSVGFGTAVAAAAVLSLTVGVVGNLGNRIRPVPLALRRTGSFRRTVVGAQVCLAGVVLGSFIPRARDSAEEVASPRLKEGLVVASIAAGGGSDRPSKVSPVAGWRFGAAVPGADGRSRTIVRLPGAQMSPVGVNAVSRGFLELVGIPVLKGAALHSVGRSAAGEAGSVDSAGEPEDVLIDQALCSTLFGQADPVGQIVQVDEWTRPARIVGVVQDLTYAPRDVPTMYVRAGGDTGDLLAVKRSDGPLQASLGPSVVGPFPISDLNAAERGLAARELLLAAVVLLGQSLVLFSAIRAWAPGERARRLDRYRLQRTLGARRKDIVLGAARDLAAPLLIGGVGAFVLMSAAGGTASPATGAILAGFASLLAAAPELRVTLVAEAPLSIDAVRADPA